MDSQGIWLCAFQSCWRSAVCALLKETHWFFLTPAYTLHVCASMQQFDLNIVIGNIVLWPLLLVDCSGGDHALFFRGELLHALMGFFKGQVSLQFDDNDIKVLWLQLLFCLLDIQMCHDVFHIFYRLRSRFRLIFWVLILILNIFRHQLGQSLVV